jgi:multimeric flavodoxin WrbA
LQIIALLASPRGRTGNTGRLLELVVDAAERRGANVEWVELSGEDVLPCVACDACHRTGCCARKDGFEAVRRRLLQADALVLGSPNYVFNVSAQMKAFMDRCCGVIHCQAFRGKYGASVVTSGGGGEEGVTEILNRFLLSTGVVPVGSVWATTGGAVAGELPAEVRSAAAELGETLVDACRHRARYPQSDEWIAEFRDRMRSLVSSRREEWPYEYEYWRALQETT